jgi:hypothetical protein
MLILELPSELIILILSHLIISDIVRPAFAQKYFFELAGHVAYPYCLFELTTNVTTATKGAFLS